MKFQKAIDIYIEKEKNGEIINELFPIWLHNNFINDIKNKVIKLDNKTKKLIEDTIILYMLFSDNEIYTLERAIEITIEKNNKVKKYYNKHKTDIDNIISKLSRYFNIKRIVDYDDLI